MSEVRSGRQKGDENVAALEAYLASVDVLPARSGKVCAAAVAEACGFDRQVLYKNPRARALLERAVEEKGLVGIEAREATQSDAKVQAMEGRVKMLETRNAALQAEVASLRAKLKRLEHVERVMESGRRVIP